MWPAAVSSGSHVEIVMRCGRKGTLASTKTAKGAWCRNDAHDECRRWGGKRAAENAALRQSFSRPAWLPPSSIVIQDRTDAAVLDEQRKFGSIPMPFS
jgi:hypothetical protein